MSDKKNPDTEINIINDSVIHKKTTITNEDGSQVTKNEIEIKPSKKGAAAGAAAGLLVGGPIGAVVGGAIGGFFGPKD